MATVKETVKKVLDPEKIKKNSIDVFGLFLGVLGGTIVHNSAKGKLPFPMVSEPLITFLPGVSGAILLEDPFYKSIAKGFATVGMIDGGQKLVNNVPFLEFFKPHVPKVSNAKTVAGLGRMGRLGDLKKSDVLLGLTGGSREAAAVWM